MKKLFFFLLLTTYYLLPTTVHAVDIGAIFGPATSGYTTVNSLVNVITHNLLTVAGIIAFLGVVFAGIRMIQSAGDAKAQEQSQGALTAAVIGLLIILGAYFILEIAKVIVGFDFINPPIP